MEEGEQHTRHERTVDASVSSAAGLTVHKLPREQEDPSIPEESIRHVSSTGDSASGDYFGDGSYTFSVEGTSPKGETGSLRACQTLIDRLNRDGAHWGELKDTSSSRGRDETGVDCIAKDGVNELHMQVTRAETNERFWQTLARQGVVTDTSMPSATVDQVAEALYNSACKKAKLASRSKVVLVLDAQRAPAHGYAAVAKRCRLNHGDALRALGFQAIWLVGLTPEMTARLDADINPNGGCV